MNLGLKTSSMCLIYISTEYILAMSVLPRRGCFVIFLS